MQKTPQHNKTPRLFEESNRGNWFYVIAHASGAVASFLGYVIIFSLLLFGCKAKQDNDIEYNEGNVADNREQITEEPYEANSADSSASIPSGMATLQKYQYTWSSNDKLPPMVIIIDDFGQSAGELLNDYGKLPKEVAFAILPDLPHTKTAARLADQTNHEALIHIPMLAENNSVSPGKRYIKPGMDVSSVADMLNDFYSQIPNAIAANNHMGSKSTADYNTMLLVLAELREMGIFFLDSATTSKSAVPSASKALNVLSAKRDIFLDVPDNSDATLINKIQGLAKYKGRNEPIVVITHCHNRDKLQALQKFIAQVTDMGIELIPPSKLLKANI